MDAICLIILQIGDEAVYKTVVLFSEGCPHLSLVVNLQGNMQPKDYVVKD